MNASLMGFEIAVLLLGLGVLLLDLWLPAEKKPQLGYLAALGVVLLFVTSFLAPPQPPKAREALVPVTVTNSAASLQLDSAQGGAATKAVAGTNAAIVVPVIV